MWHLDYLAFLFPLCPIQHKRGSVTNYRFGGKESKPGAATRRRVVGVSIPLFCRFFPCPGQATFSHFACLSFPSENSGAARPTRYPNAALLDDVPVIRFNESSATICLRAVPSASQVYAAQNTISVTYNSGFSVSEKYSFPLSLAASQKCRLPPTLLLHLPLMQAHTFLHVFVSILTSLQKHAAFLHN